MKKNKNLRNNVKGFTLIELLVVIAIVGILAGVVMILTGSARDKAKMAKAKSDMKQIQNSIHQAHVFTGKTLLQMTGSNCSDCICRTTTDWRGINSNNLCYTNWANDLINIENNAGLSTGSLSNAYARDPWGSPYGLDENELEAGSCTKDSLTTYGPDGVYGTGDDYSIQIPFGACLK